MEARDCLENLKAAGFKAGDLIGVLGVSGGAIGALEDGRALKPLEERHLLSNYMAFTKRAKMWSERAPRP